METPWKFIVQEGDNDYYCVICGCDIAGYMNAGRHVKGKHHANALDEYGHDISHDGYHIYYCHLCGCRVSGYLNVRSHLKGRRHQDYLYDTDESFSDSYYSDYDNNYYYY